MADEDDDDDSGAPRPFWSGTIAFGLISLPVSLFPANRGKSLSLKMVDADGTPLARRYFCEKEGKALTRDDIVRGYKVDEETYVVVEDEELESLAPEKSREIDLRRFVSLDAIDPMYFERAYFLTPDEGATKAYRLLAKSMEDEKRAGIATFVMRGKEYLCAIVAEKGILRAETLRFHDEVRTPEDVGLPERKKVSKDSVQQMQKAMRALAAKGFDRDELADAQARRLLALAKKKLKSGKDVVRAPEEVAEEAAAESNVVDLMQVLKERLQGKAPRGGQGRGSRDDTEKRSTGKSEAEKKSGRAQGKSAREDREDEGKRSARGQARTEDRARGKGTSDGDEGETTRARGTRNAPAATRRKPASAASSGRKRPVAEDLEALPKADLYERAQARDIPGRSAMSKPELIKALTQH